MKSIAWHYRPIALCITLLFSVAFSGTARAQAPAENQPAKAVSQDELSQAELLKSYLQIRDQLHAAQLAIVNNRVESETTARVQAAAFAEKLEALKSAMNTERDRQQVELQRVNAERARQQAESEKSMRTILWVAAAFGAVGLVAMLVMPLFQWRTINRMAEMAAVRPALGPPSSGPALLPGSAGIPSGQAVSVSSQRMMSVIDRMERRILELEQTATPTPSAPPETPAASNGHAEVTRRTEELNGRETWITVLMAKGRSLLSTNKPNEAVACYDEILKLDANHTEALVRKGAALERLNRFEEALLCYNRAIEVDHRMTLAYLHKGGVCNRLERYDEAVECYEQALRTQEESKPAAAHV